MKPEEYSIMGLILLLFGILLSLVGWILIFAPAGALLFLVGVLAIAIGGLMLYQRWHLYTGTGQEKMQTTLGTPASFLKKCPNCGRDLPIAAEKCYSCGARV